MINLYYGSKKPLLDKKFKRLFDWGCDNGDEEKGRFEVFCFVLFLAVESTGFEARLERGIVFSVIVTWGLEGAMG